LLVVEAGGMVRLARFRESRGGGDILYGDVAVARGEGAVHEHEEGDAVPSGSFAVRIR
jgi:hypothetical protein